MNNLVFLSTVYAYVYRFGPIMNLSKMRILQIS